MVVRRAEERTRQVGLLGGLDFSLDCAPMVLRTGDPEAFGVAQQLSCTLTCSLCRL